MTALLYISYGMAKSGSTLGFRLVSAVLEEAGAPQEDIDLREAIPGAHARFVEVIRPRELAALKAYAKTRAKGPVVVKTHGGLWRCVEDGLREGWIIGHAIARDPRDIMLSMLDAAREKRAWGKGARPITDIEDALPVVRGQADKFAKWATAPGILPLAYEPLAFDTAGAAARIAAQLGVKVDAERCARIAKDAATNFNRGEPRRHEREMSPELTARIGDVFSGFIAHWCAPEFEAPRKKRGLLSRIARR